MPSRLSSVTRLLGAGTTSTHTTPSSYEGSGDRAQALAGTASTQLTEESQSLLFFNLFFSVRELNLWFYSCWASSILLANILSPYILPFNFIFTFIYFCVRVGGAVRGWVHILQQYMEVRGQLSGVRSLLPPHVFWGLNSNR